jgi:carboxyl-terminal processing protease
MLYRSFVKKSLIALLLVVCLACAACESGSGTLANLPKNADIDASAASSLVLQAVANQTALQHDKYAIYYTSDAYAELIQSVKGSYSGIGVYIYPDENGYALVYGVMRNGPAYKAGILPGDVFLKINDQDLTGMDYSEVSDLMTSYPKGTQLELVLQRPEVGEVEITVTTDIVDIPTLDYEMLDNGVGLIKISSFNMTTGDQFEEAYNELESEGMQGLIIDLRNNGGGELTAALKICDYFVPKGEPLMYITEADGSYYYSAAQDNVDIPLVVLQNGHTASSSEILLGAVHDNEAGTTIGETSYGKGIVQTLVRLGSGSGLRYTSSKYSTSHKNDIHGVGIEPDIYYPMPDDADQLAAYTMDPEQDPQLAKAVEVLLEKIETVDENAAGNSAENTDEKSDENSNAADHAGENAANAA